METRKVLIVDDEKNITFVMKAILEKGGFQVDSFNHSEEALNQIKQNSHIYSAIITDLFMPGINGMKLLEEVKSIFPELPVIMITAFGTVDSAVEAIKKGAFDYVSKPFDQGEILAIVTKAVNTYTLNQKEPTVGGPDKLMGQSFLMSRSQQMNEIRNLIYKTAATPSPVFITGEVGTGKELMALEIHRLSDRTSNPFIKLNCAAIASSQIEYELFGLEKGTETGMVNSKPGRFELAEQGTLFLDEIDKLSLDIQIKLLNLLIQNKVERVGGLQSIPVNVRLIVATNKDMQKEMSEGRFSKDLFYKLNVISIHIPGLRKRRVDIEDLIYNFVRTFNEKLNKNIESIDQEFMEKCLTYHWPGNIRQLENVIERAVLFSESNQLKLKDIPEDIISGTDQVISSGDVEKNQILSEYKKGKPFKDIIRFHTQEMERKIIEEALTQMDGNITKTAERLGLSRKGLQLKLKELGLAAPRLNKDET